ncbi:L-amino acid N-acyltransferase YncA [Pseudobutyrivibrio sp. YE44]|uniref:GNAT family N-acetyltransferase n=1 Tax=Pseudobutyrivibrio sp. YE44 TaxID=1520802 RepID=UPI00088F95F3|nr:GNAT family N-acetyltransferase [Pseudobutyrivibrio sp. YE44]SDB13637.1 L-amino acid N-acyltransferase YncA [Pseudobutyrivibrio sp. YE44]
MRIDPITIKDKLGREVVLRAARSEDAEDLIQYLKVTCGETPYLIREPNEVTITMEEELTFIKSKLENDRELLLVAYIDGKHVGNCSIMSFASYKRYQHRCDVAIALYQEYCGCGIGRAMLETVLDVATKLGYEQAELEVVADNENAISLYEKLGFKKYGTFPDNMKYSDGTYCDAYWMMKKLV